MTNKHRQKGTWFENEIVDLLKKWGFADAHRTEAGKASHDIRLPGINIVVECKNRKTWSIPAWVRAIRAVAPTGRWVVYASPGDRRTVEGKAVGTVAVMDAEWATELIANYYGKEAA